MPTNASASPTDDVSEWWRKQEEENAGIATPTNPDGTPQLFASTSHPQQPVQSEAPAEQTPASASTGGSNNGGYVYQGRGFQPQQRSAVPQWGGSVPPPPPPPPPPPAPMGAAPDFMGMVNGLPPATQGAGYQQTQGPAPAQMGPQYQTAEGAFQGEGMASDLEAFARDWMQDYNPYATGVVESTRAAGDARRNAAVTEQTRQLEELMAKRGTLGSSIETDGYIQMLDTIERQRLDEEESLNRLLADYELQGRSAAGAMGLQAGDLSRALGNDRRLEGQYQHEADRTRSRDFEDDTRYRSDFAQRENQFGQDFDRQVGRDYQSDILDRARLGLDAASRQEDSAQGRRQLDLSEREILGRETMDRARLDIDREALNQRAYEIQVDALLRGQQMDLQEAIASAENEMGRNHLAQNESQFRRRYDLDEWIAQDSSYQDLLRYLNGV